MNMTSDSVKSFIFDLDDYKAMADSYCLLGGIGYEKRNAVLGDNYCIECMNPARNECTFQYTLSGEGVLEIGKKAYSVTAGQGFIVEKPGNFRYYKPGHASHWEFRWIALNIASMEYWQSIVARFGRVFDLPVNSATMRYWETAYKEAEAGAIKDVYLSSACAYTFCMQLLHDLSDTRKQASEQDQFRFCLQVIQNDYANPSLSLSALAKQLGISDPSLSKTFNKYMKKTFIQYLTKIRISKARDLLATTSMPVESIAKAVGLPDANYFARVFKRATGMTPSCYRKSKSTVDNAFQITCASVVLNFDKT